MRIFHVIVSIFCLAVFFSCSMINVTVDYDKENDFSRYQNYKWIKQKRIPNPDNLLLNDINMKRFAYTIQNELSKKGFKRIEKGEADFSVVYHIRLEKKLDISTYSYSTWPYYRKYYQTRVYKQGSLIIDIIDVEEKLVVWRGVAEGVFSEYEDDWKTGAKLEDRIKEIIKEILKDFPPKTK